MKKYVIVAIAIVAMNFGGCFSQQITDTMKSWEGSHYSQLLQSWGPPTQTSEDGLGGQILVYMYDRNLGQIPGRAWKDNYGVVHYTAPQGNNYTATRMFYVNKDGIIYSWRWQGF